MFKYTLKRIGLMLITFVITVFVYFVFIKLIPDNYVPDLGGYNEWYEIHKAREGWDKPILVQFGIWVKNIFTTGSFGFSHILKEMLGKFTSVKFLHQLKLILFHIY